MIKTSFQKSLMTVQENFSMPEFEELRGVISIYALSMILSEFKRSSFTGVDPVACGCVLRRTHNLPCAHELAMYKEDGRPIPLGSIDRHWSKLDMLPSPKTAIVDISCEAELELFIKRFEEANNDGKLQLLMKLREILNPSTSTLGDPIVKTTVQDPSTFELIGSECDSTSPLVHSTIVAKMGHSEVGTEETTKGNSLLLL